LIFDLTVFVKGLGANSEYDLRKMTALSALAHLGLIVQFRSAGLSGLSSFLGGFIFI
jgi:hypothetical protein